MTVMERFDKTAQNALKTGEVPERGAMSETQENLLKEGVDFLFEKFPAMTTLGTKGQYAQYLKNVFPNSKIKDIGYKGVATNFKEEDKPSFYTFSREPATYYASLRKGTEVLCAIFNFRNPLVVDAERPAPIPIVDSAGTILGMFDDPDINQKIQAAGYDGLILNRKFDTPMNGWEVLSFNSNGRHLLGSEVDAGKFKEFIAGT